MGVYREYGYIIHLTYDFEPLPTAAYDDMNGYANTFLTDNAPYLDQMQTSAIVTGLEYLSDIILEHANDFVHSVRDLLI